MKQSPQQKDLDERLISSRFSGPGFLGTDTRPLDEIIAADMRVLQRNEISLETVSDTLQLLYSAGRNALDFETVVDPGITVRYYESKGKIPSPFQGEGVFEKGEASVTHQSLQHRLRLTALGIHLIRTHGFFQGIGSPYRVEPEDVIMLSAEMNNM